MPQLPRLARVKPLGPWTVVAGCLVVGGCSSGKAEARPTPPPGETVASDSPQSTSAPVVPDPPPSRVVLHVTVAQEALERRLEESIPKDGTGETAVLTRTVPYRWVRDDIRVKFDRGRVVLLTKVTGTVTLLGERIFPIDLVIAGEPVMTAEYQAKLQSVEVKVTSKGPVDKANRVIEETLHGMLVEKLEGFVLDVRPILTGAYERIARPLPLPVPGENACATLRIVAIEAAPTVLAGGIEKDFGVVVLPSVTMPCEPAPDEPPPLPLLANVASLPSGPFQVVVPVAARYDEISRSMEAAMGGRLYFSQDQPGLYLENPSVYASNESLVIKVNIGGRARVAGLETPLDGELFLTGHPKVVDNQVIVPDLELTPGSANALVRLKFAVDGKAIRDQAQQAIRLDLSERLHAAREKLSTQLNFEEGDGCVRAQVLRAEVTGIHPHQGFLRIYVSTYAQASLYMPCPP
jgi:hypothetical protein